MSVIRILVMEDEPIIAMDITASLEELGFEPLEVVDNGPEALRVIMEEKPDLVLLDINVEGIWDGIETAGRIRREANMPIIFLSALSDPATVERAKLVSPDAYLIKPFRERELQIAIEMALYKYSDSYTEKEDDTIVLKDAIFVKDKNRLLKVMLKDVLWIEADSNYAKVITSEKEYFLSSNLGSISEKLKHATFARVHRSYLVNLIHLQAIEDSMVVLVNKSIPISKSYRKEFMEQLNRL